MDCKFYHNDQRQGDWCEKYPDAEFPRCFNRGGCEYENSQQTQNETMTGGKPEKLYILFDNPYTVDYRKLNKRRYDEEVEYTRTDAFIEKACEWMEQVLKDLVGYNCAGDLIRDFKKLMEEEEK